MSERLAEIKADIVPFGPDEKAWLIAEIERLKTTVCHWDRLSETLHAEIERLRASLEKQYVISDKRDDEICTEAHAEGMEQAAVIAEQALGDNDHGLVAAAIRAKIKRV